MVGVGRVGNSSWVKITGRLVAIQRGGGEGVEGLSNCPSFWGETLHRGGRKFNRGLGCVVLSKKESDGDSSKNEEKDVRYRPEDQTSRVKDRVTDYFRGESNGLKTANGGGGG